MVCAFERAPGFGRRGAALGLALALVGCGRVSLGSTEEVGDGGSARGGAGGDGAKPRGGSTGSPAGAGGNAAAGAAGVGAGGSGGSGSGAADAGADAGGPVFLPPSCAARDPQCGDGASRASCCEALVVSGGSFELEADSLTPEATVAVTVSSFRLDRFEVTVGRMREFVARYDEFRQLGRPEEGLGAHPRIAGSGWQERFSEQLPASGEELAARLGECGASSPSTYAEGSSDEVPLNCVSWLEAAAFCAWDGGRLPTLRELAYAGSGGALERTYPWGDEPVPSRAHALFGCIIDSTSPVCTVADITPVGTHPAGRGFFGQDDLAGSMSEWVLDVPAPLEACTDCAALGPDESLRRWRASGWTDRAELMDNAFYFALPPELRTNYLGVRCARDE